MLAKWEAIEPLGADALKPPSSKALGFTRARASGHAHRVGHARPVFLWAGLCRRLVRAPRSACQSSALGALWRPGYGSCLVPYGALARRCTPQGDRGVGLSPRLGLPVLIAPPAGYPLGRELAPCAGRDADAETQTAHAGWAVAVFGAHDATGLFDSYAYALSLRAFYATSAFGCQLPC